MSWHWARAVAIGTSHIRAGAGCDDFSTIRKVGSTSGEILIAAVSDGAGSAKLSAIGARITAQAFCRAASQQLHESSLDDIAEDEVTCWLDDIRDRVHRASVARGAKFRDFAATLVGAIFSDQETIVAHVGDGALVYRLTGTSTWQVASWPAQGEFAATTYFVTDDFPKIVFNRIVGSVEEAALFTDGLEKLLLDFGSRAAFPPAFDQLFPALRKSTTAGLDRPLSRLLRDFLNSSKVTDRTDDDKSLILLRRVTHVSAG